MEADELASEILEAAAHYADIGGLSRDVKYESGHEDSAFFVELPSGERFLVTVAKVGE